MPAFVKRAFFTLAMLLVAVGVLEVASYGVYYLIYKETFTYSSIAAQQNYVLSRLKHVADPTTASDSNNGIAVHPYMGFVRNPDKEFQPKNLQKNGFIAEQDPLEATKNPDIAIVGISGGSVAEFMFESDRARQVLHSYIDNLPAFANKKVIFAMFGMQAYSQPQQLMAVNYYLVQGGRLDMLINLDGKNEVDVPYSTRHRGIYPIYPEAWKEFFPGSFGEYTLQNIGNVYLWKNIRYNLASYFKRAEYSVTAGLLWRMVNEYALQKEFHAEGAIHNYANRPKPYFLRGSDALDSLTPEQFQDYVITVWRQGSMQLSQLAAANGFSYFHFLQPNQYMAGSKNFTPREREIAFVTSTTPPAHGVSLSKTYPRLIAQMPAMRERGANVYDLTGIFKKTREDIYIDNCCHVNELGNVLLAENIGKLITRHYAGAKR